MRLYLKALSDTHQEIAIGGNKDLSVKLLYGSAKNSKQAVKVRLEYDPKIKRTWLIIEGPKHNQWDERKGITHFDLSRQVLPE